MKPSNTGPWVCKCQTLHHRVAGDGCDECNPDMARQIEIDNAVDDAIAEYRKEAKAEWQQELAAKVGAVRRYDYVSYGGDYELELNAEGDYANVHDVLSLLNENDNAE